MSMEVIGMGSSFVRVNLIIVFLCTLSGPVAAQPATERRFPEDGLRKGSEQKSPANAEKERGGPIDAIEGTSTGKLLVGERTQSKSQKGLTTDTKKQEGLQVEGQPTIFKERALTTPLGATGKSDSSSKSSDKKDNGKSIDKKGTQCSDCQGTEAIFPEDKKKKYPRPKGPDIPPLPDIPPPPKK
jgi:hypothetical protein